MSGLCPMDGLGWRRGDLHLHLSVHAPAHAWGDGTVVGTWYMVQARVKQWSESQRSRITK